MELVMFSKNKEVGAGVIDGDEIVDINANDKSLPPSLKGILEANGLARVRKVLKSKKHRTPLARAKFLAPIQNPALVLSVGMNYHEHLKEMKTPAPEKPAAFTKSVASIIGPGAADPLSAGNSAMVDWEGEFSVVIGKPCHRVKAAQALDYVAGYTIVNDVSARDWVAPIFPTGIMGPIHAWEHNLLGKMFPTFCPMGPCIATKDEMPDPATSRSNPAQRPGHARREYRRPGLQRAAVDRVLLAVLSLPARRRHHHRLALAASASGATRRYS